MNVMSLAGLSAHHRSTTTPPSSEPTKNASPGQDLPEPFGQTGVRQYMGRMFTWVCITAALCALAMWYRSLAYYDSAEWNAQGQTFAISSAFGRMQLRAESVSDNGNREGWGYRGGYFRRTSDAWQPSIWKTIGIEFGTSTIRRDATSTIWLRAKWYFVAGVFALLPFLRWLLGLRRSRDDAE